MEGVSLEIVGSLGWIRLNNSRSRNPISMAMARGLTETLHELRERNDVRAVLLDGGPHFCAGGDLKEMQEVISGGARSIYEMFETMNKAILALYEFPKPTIAVVRGYAVGAGMSLALAADFVFAGTSAKFGQVFINTGGAPDGGSSWLLQSRVGLGRAKLLAFSGRIVGADEACAMGLIDAVHADDEVAARAQELALEFASKPQFALIMTKQALHRAATGNFREALAMEAEMQSLMSKAHDLPEAIKAFSEKREPRFRDR